MPVLQPRVKVPAQTFGGGTANDSEVRSMGSTAAHPGMSVPQPSFQILKRAVMCKALAHQRLGFRRYRYSTRTPRQATTVTLARDSFCPCQLKVAEHAVGLWPAIDGFSDNTLGRLSVQCDSLQSTGSRADQLSRANLTQAVSALRSACLPGCFF